MGVEHHTFTIDDYRLHYVTAGSAYNPPLVMLHGYTSSHHVWRTTIPALESHFYCVALDLLGHGESDLLPHGDYSIIAQGKRVLALADKLGFERFSLIGHSMGGQISLCIAALLAPERIENVIDVAGVVAAKLTPFIEETVFKPLKMLYATPMSYLMESYTRIFSPRFKFAARNQFASWWYDFDSRDFDWWRIDRDLANRRGMRHVWFHGMNAIEGMDLTVHLPNIKARTLVVFGDKDNVVPVSDGTLVEKCVPNSQLKLIANCGHFPMYECEQEYLQILCDYLFN